MATKAETIKQLKAKLKDAWLRGKEQRIEIGTLLLELRQQAEHGEWGKVLAELGIPASTAADYMMEASRQIHGIRVFENGELTTRPDPEAGKCNKLLTRQRPWLMAKIRFPQRHLNPSRPSRSLMNA